MDRNSGPAGTSRYQCPRGHTRLRPSGEGYYCKGCGAWYKPDSIVDTHERYQRRHEDTP